MNNVADLMLTSLDTITAQSLTGEPRFIMDELQDANISNSEEKTAIVGKQGRTLGNLKKNKAVKITGTNGLLSAGMLEAQLGTAFAKKDNAAVNCVDYLVVKSNGATTEFKAVGTAGAEITALYVVDETGAASKVLEQVSGEPTSGQFKYEASSKKLTFFASELEDDTQIVVEYIRNVAANVIENLSDKYSEKLRLYIDGTAEDKCGNVFHVQFYVPKADFSGNFELALGGDQTVHGFEAESLAGSCGTQGSLWTYTVFGVNEPDAGVSA